MLSIFVNCENLSNDLKSTNLGSIGHVVVTNDLDQTLEKIEIEGLENLGDDLGYKTFPRMSIHDNCDIPRPLSYLSLVHVLIYVAHDWTCMFDKLKRALTRMDVCFSFYSSHIYFSELCSKGH